MDVSVGTRLRVLRKDAGHMVGLHHIPPAGAAGRNQPGCHQPVRD